MKPDLVKITKHQADAIQSGAELKRMDAQARKDSAKQKLDDELGLSKKRMEFQKRLNEAQQSSKEEFQELMRKFKSDWDDFKKDAVKKFEKAGRIGDAQLDLLEAQIDGLDARIEYVVGKVAENDASDAERIRKALLPVTNGVSKLNSDIKEAIGKGKEYVQKNLGAYDKQLQNYKQELEVIISKEMNKDSKELKH